MYREEKIVLCASNSYEKKYYLNPDFEALPEQIKNELKIMCVVHRRNRWNSCVEIRGRWNIGI